ncbi:MAG: redoxin domain-containing protein [Candidatus Nitrosocaldus sp.]
MRKSRKRYMIVIGGVGCCIGIALIVIILMVNSQNLQPTTANSASIGSASIGGLPINTTAPDFKLFDIEKGEISKELLKGKPLFIFFTTTWCTPCQVGAKQLAKYYDETNAGFNVLIIFVDPTEDYKELVKWRQQYGRDSWYIVKDNEQRAVKDYNIRYLDSKYVLDKDGIVRYFDIRPLSYITAKNVLEPLLR